MIYVVNIITILLAVVFTVLVSHDKNKLPTSAGLIIIGLAFHVFDAYHNYTGNKCKSTEFDGLLQLIDNCIDYDSGVMLYAQAMIIAGFTVLFVNFFLRKTSSN